MKKYLEKTVYDVEYEVTKAERKAFELYKTGASEYKVYAEMRRNIVNYFKEMNDKHYSFYVDFKNCYPEDMNFTLIIRNRKTGKNSHLLFSADGCWLITLTADEYGEFSRDGFDDYNLIIISGLHKEKIDYE